jgi:beta-glucanase (GH16 family)
VTRLPAYAIVSFPRTQKDRPMTSRKDLENFIATHEQNISSEERSIAADERALAAMEDGAAPAPTPAPQPTPTPTPTPVPAPVPTPTPAPAPSGLPALDFGPVTATIASLSVPLGFSGRVLVAVTLDRPVSYRSSFHLNTVNGNDPNAALHAISGYNFAAHDEWVIFEPGETCKAFPVSLGGGAEGQWFIIGNQEQVGVSNGSGTIDARITFTAKGVAPPTPAVDKLTFPAITTGAVIWQPDMTSKGFKSVDGGAPDAWNTSMRTQPNNNEPTLYNIWSLANGLKPVVADSQGLTLNVATLDAPVTYSDHTTYAFGASAITSSAMFSALYYNASADLSLPTAPFAWMGFWMMPADGSWPPEIDILEVENGPSGGIGNRFLTQHPGSGGFTSFTAMASYLTQLGVDLSKPSNTYSIDWRADWLTWLIDGIVVNRQHNTINKPMFLLFDNTLTGGAWNQKPDLTKGNGLGVRNLVVRA